MTIAVVFPGQGSQSVGMADVWTEHPAGRDVFGCLPRRPEATPVPLPSLRPQNRHDKSLLSILFITQDRLQL